MTTQHGDASSQRSGDRWEFHGFASPTTTPVPDEFFDIIAPHLSEAELRVLLYIIRRTFGFKKQSDAISLTQMVEGIRTKDGRVLDHGTGMSRRGVMKGCAGLIEKGVIQVNRGLTEKGDSEINIYSLHFREERGVGNDVPYGREQHALRVGNGVPPQDTVKQQTVKQQTDEDPSNIRKTSLEKNDKTTRGSNKTATAPSISQQQQDSTNRQIDQIQNKSDDTQGDQVQQFSSQNIRTAPAKHDLVINSKAENLTPRATANDFEKIDIILKQQPVLGAPTADEAREVIDAYIRDFARELHDAAPVKSSVTRAFRLYRQSNWTLDGFISALYEARAITKDRSASIHATDGAKVLPAKRKMAYFFACLEDKLGLRETPSIDALR